MEFDVEEYTADADVESEPSSPRNVPVSSDAFESLQRVREVHYLDPGRLMSQQLDVLQATEPVTIKAIENMKLHLVALEKHKAAIVRSRDIVQTSMSSK